MDELFGIYSRALPRVCAWAEGEFPRAGDEPPAAHARAIKAKALDLLRGLLPASSLSHMGIFATGQTYEQLILHLLAHPLPEARDYGRMILEELQSVIPSFLTRVERPDRGGAVDRVPRGPRREPAARWARRLGLDAADEARPARRSRCCAPTATRTTCWPRCCSRPARPPRSASASAVAALDDERAPRCWPTWPASAPTAATGPGAGSRRCATGSRSSPTTAPSAISSATGC